MTSRQPLFESNLKSLNLRARGKVRDIYDIDADFMLIVATDRISAFDCILPDPIPNKGKVLTSISEFWFKKLAHLVPNQQTSIKLSEVIKDPEELLTLEGRAVIVKKLNALPIEAVVRGYLIGSGWKDYRSTGGIIIADTKFEFGTDADGRLHLIDEVLTPDSSRFWPVDSYKEGLNPPSFDKQFVRDYLEQLDWDKTPPAPHLPASVIERTAEVYREAQQRLTTTP